jgi:hypothetical protein
VSGPAGTHPCPAGPCPRAVPNHLLMCGPHWHMVPRPIQRAVNAAYHNPAQGIGSVQLFNAQRAAINAVNKQLEGTTNA